MASGNKYQVETDTVGTGPFPLPITRTFNALSGTWRFMPEISLDTAGTTALVVPANGQGLSFVLIGSGTWSSDPDIKDVLESFEDGNGMITGWQLTTPENTVEVYNATEQLLSITDLCGYVQTVSYDANNRLDRIDTNIGASLQFSVDALDR